MTKNLMIRSGRFRHRLLDDQFLQTHAKDLHAALVPFLNLWDTKALSDAEMAGIYIFIFSFFRRPVDFLGGPHNSFVFKKRTDVITGKKVFEILRDHLPPALATKKSLTRINQETAFLDLFCSMSWRSIPLSVPRSLMAWQNDIYPLRLTTGLPTPEEVLHLQCQGQRCVSMLIKENQIASFVEEGRDVLGFIVHDLIHADHFFADADRARAQILFCQRLQVVFNTPKIQEMLKTDSVFQREFFYLMSDMNSVPLHLLKTLKAVLLGYFKRQQNSFQRPLPPSQENEFLALFALSLRPWNLDETAWKAALRLNTPEFCAESDLMLLDTVLNKLS